MLFFLNFLFYQVNRTAFYFHVCLCQILPQNTRAEKLYAAGHQDDAHQRRPAGHRISEDQLPHDDKYDHQKAMMQNSTPTKEAIRSGAVEMR